MTPYYEHGGITIYHGDCCHVIEEWEGLRTQSFDLLLTDPPYGLNRDGMRASTGSHGGRKPYPFLGWDDAPISTPVLCRCIAICRDAVIWGGNYFALKPRAGWFVWDKGQRIDQSDGELAWTSSDRALRIFTVNRSSLAQDGAVHPTQKPQALMRWCLEQYPGAVTVLDPFMGSGTTLVAAKRLGRQCVGIEREERYCEIAAKRLAQDVLPLGDDTVRNERTQMPLSLVE
jgi:DNA modification methylase